eukprot:6467650-Amphidinium_carterae.1
MYLTKSLVDDLTANHNVIASRSRYNSAAAAGRTSKGIQGAGVTLLSSQGKEMSLAATVSLACVHVLARHVIHGVRGPPPHSLCVP